MADELRASISELTTGFGPVELALEFEEGAAGADEFVDPDAVLFDELGAAFSSEDVLVAFIDLSDAASATVELSSLSLCLIFVIS